MSKHYCRICKKRIRGGQEHTAVPLLQRENKNIKGAKNIAKIAFKAEVHMDCWKKTTGQPLHSSR